MEFRNYLIGVIVVSCAACATSQKSKTSDRNTYQATVRQEMAKVGESFTEDSLFHWNAPIVQELRVPAHIKNGVFIPEHQELVMIKPGEWAKQAAFPISTQKEHYATNDDDMVRDDIIDITSVPGSVGQTRSYKSGR